QLLLQHQLEDAQPVEQFRSGVPPGVSAVVRKLMAKRPEDRFQTPAALVQALEALGRGGRTFATTTVALGPSARGAEVASLRCPPPQAYDEATRPPRPCFGDPELRDSQPTLNAEGVPLPRSGNSADVYQLVCPATRTRWAVKCFTRPVVGLRER